VGASPTHIKFSYNSFAFFGLSKFARIVLFDFEVVRFLETRVIVLAAKFHPSVVIFFPRLSQLNSFRYDLYETNTRTNLADKYEQPSDELANCLLLAVSLHQSDRVECSIVIGRTRQSHYNDGSKLEEPLF
jgi:hypothetical protein